jgi:guanylate kinase
VLPPTAEELKFRLERRAEDTPEIIERRLRNAAEEIPHWDEYDYVLVNRDVQKSLARLRGILTAERLQRVRKETIQEFVDELLSDLDSLST